MSDPITTNTPRPSDAPGSRNRDSTDALITKRNKTHGDFADHAACTQNLKFAMQEFRCQDNSRPWEALTICQRESLDMIAHKIGRILAGDPDFRDHWEDIAGYARLVAERCGK